MESPLPHPSTEPANIDAEPTPGFFDPPGSELHVQKWRAQVDLRLSTVARAMARGKLRTPRQIARVAMKLNVKPEILKLWVTDPRVIKETARYSTAMAIPEMALKAKEDVQAFKTLASIGGLIESGPKVQVNTAIDNRTRGDTNSDRAFFEKFRKRVDERIDAAQSDTK